MVQLLRVTARKYLKLSWTIFQHLVELSVLYTLLYDISKNDCVYFLLKISCLFDFNRKMKWKKGNTLMEFKYLLFCSSIDLFDIKDLKINLTDSNLIRMNDIPNKFILLSSLLEMCVQSLKLILLAVFVLELVKYSPRRNFSLAKFL